MTGKVHISRPFERVVLLELDNPPMNPMSATMLGTMAATLEGIDQDEAVRAVILTGRGAAFCSGADLKAETRNKSSAEGNLGTFAHVLQLLAGLRAPTVAAINGHCIGGGFELALCCDLRIASTSASFVCAGVNVGLMASTYRLPRLIGVSRAKAMLLTGLPHDADVAERWGVVTAIHEPDALMDQALRLAARIASRAPLSVEASKRVADRAVDMSPEEAKAMLAVEMPILRQSQDHREGVRAFAERREPVFTRA